MIFHINARFGIVLKELGLKQEALEILVQSVEKEPLLWATWIEIASLCNTKEEVWDLCNEFCLTCIYNWLVVGQFHNYMHL